jgi:hypothetical protein
MRSDLMILTVGETRLEAKLQRGALVLWNGQMDYRDRQDLSDAIAGLVAEPALVKPGKRLLVELERPVVQLRTLQDIPPVRANQLRVLVEQQGHRFFRKNGCPLIIDAVRAGNHRNVRAVAVEEPVVAAIAEGARAGGFYLEDVRPAEWPNPRLSLLPSAERDRRKRLARLSLRRIGVAVILLWTGAIAVGITSHLRQARSVDRELARLSEPVAALREARRQEQLIRETIATLDVEDSKEGRMADMLGAIAGALPDSAFVTSIAIDSAGVGVIGGYGKRASEVLARLDAAVAVVAPTLDNQGSRQTIAGREWETFSIRFGDSGHTLGQRFVSP